MNTTINMRVNYPVLKEQEESFRKIIDAHHRSYSDWLKLHPLEGTEKDRKAASTLLSSQQAAVPPERIFILNGGHHACMVTVMAAALSGHGVAVEEFSYAGFMDIARLFQVKLVCCKTDEFGMVPSSLKENAARNSVKALYLMPTLNNPTGRVMPVERRLDLAGTARTLGMQIIEDDAYGFLEENQQLSFAQLAPDISWYIYSLSKPVSPDFKTAYLVAPESFSGEVVKAIKLSTSNPTTYFSSLASSMIENNQLSDLIRLKRQKGKERQVLVKEILVNLPYQAHENGWHLWLKLPAGLPDTQFSEQLLLKGVQVIPGSAFAPENPASGQFIRIALGGERETEPMIQGLKIISSVYGK